jgi:hypothetical protein
MGVERAGSVIDHRNQVTSRPAPPTSETGSYLASPTLRNWHGAHATHGWSLCVARGSTTSWPSPCDVRADNGKRGCRLLANPRVPGQLVAEGFTITRSRSVSTGEYLEEKARLVSSVVKLLVLIKSRRTEGFRWRRNLRLP